MTGDRFRPSRAGIINVWDYADEEFVFADGRLVLRGHNGSGKTKALEVLFPFVLDGFTDPRRLDPFSGENRTMKSNLLYKGQDAEYGYVWLEFAQPAGETGEAGDTVTLIVGLRAHKNWDRARASFFVTDKRIGVDFGLLAADSRPLTEKQLKSVLGAGDHHENATTYRRAIDDRLFGLGPERYTQLLDLLLALRRPLLAKDLDPVKVSETLTSGLSPVEEDLIIQAARDFENLAAVQKRFDDATTAGTAVTTFLTAYTDYLRVHTSARLDRVRAARTAVTQHLRDLANAATEVRRATVAHRDAAKHRQQFDTRSRELRSTLEALKKDDAYRAQGEIDLQRTQIARTEAELGAERQRLEANAQHVAELEREAGELAERLERGRETITRHATDMAEAADRSGIVHDGDGPVDTGDDLPTTTQARGAARRADVEHVRGHLTRVRDAAKDRERAESALSTADDAVAEREQACAAADRALTGARQTAADALTQWAQAWAGDTTGVCTTDDVVALTAALEQIGEAGAATLTEVFTERTEDRRMATVQRAYTLQTRLDTLDGRLADLRAERAEVASEKDDAPPADDRRPADRRDRPGAPLWRLVRFTDDLPAPAGAGIEGALHAAGLLTAWLHPDPRLTHAAVAAGEADGYLLALPPEHRPAGRTLADVLVPEEQDDVDPEAVAAVLRSIALDPQDAAPLASPPDGRAPVVSTSGQFSYGPHLGALPKPAPEYIGATNREHRRRVRLATLDTTIAAAEEEHVTTAEELATVNQQVEAFTRARAALPTTVTILKATEQVAHQSTLLGTARGERESKRQALDTAVHTVDAEQGLLRQAAAERGMPTAATEVDAVARAVDDFLDAANHLHTARGTTATVEGDLAARQARVARQSAQLATDTQAHQEKERSLASDRAALAAREEALEAPVREVLAQIEAKEQELRDVQDSLRAHADREKREGDARTRAQTTFDNGQRPLEEAIRRLFEDVEEFAPYAHRDLRPLMGVDVTEAWPQGVNWPTPAEVAAAATARMGEEAAPDSEELVRQALPRGIPDLVDAYAAAFADAVDVADSRVKSVDHRLSTALREFQDALDSCDEDYRVEHDPSGVIMVYVSDETGRNPVAAFARRMADLVDEQGVLLEDKERSVLEDELLTNLAQQIHERVRTARDLVRGMNDDTRSRPMSSGTRIGIRWAKTDGLDDNQAAVARLLERDAETLGAAGLAELRTLFREMIRGYRAGHSRATYKQAVAQVVDYRTWYAFELVLAVPGERDVKLTRAKHSVMSGGEKSAAIHLPLFAAANALYSSAKPTCPRMIALDEAFAGIDDQYKPDLLGLTVKFDLDLFMTGHDLWVHYDSVPMAAHYDLHHDKSAHAVSALLMLWDGEQTIDAEAGFAGNEELATTLLGITPSRYAPATVGNSTETTLWTANDEDAA